MDEKDKNILKNGLEQPSADFTKNVMKTIHAEEKAMAGIMQKHGVETPSDAFTANIMAKVAGKVPQPTKPVISLSVWIGIACVLIAAITLGISFGTESGLEPRVAANLESFKASIDSFFNGSSFLLYFLVAIFTIACSLLLEQRIKKSANWS